MTWTLKPPAARDANKGLTVSCTNGWSFATFSFISAFTVLDFPTPCLPINTTVNSLSPVSVCCRCMCSAILSRVGCGMVCKPIHGFMPSGGVAVEAPSEVVASSSSSNISVNVVVVVGGMIKCQIFSGVCFQRRTKEKRFRRQKERFEEKTPTI